MKNFHDTIGNRTRDLPVCSAVPHPTAPLRTPPGKLATTVIKNTPLSENTVQEPGNNNTTAIALDKFLSFSIMKVLVVFVVNFGPGVKT
jgi:hypothetical protein